MRKTTLGMMTLAMALGAQAAMAATGTMTLGEYAQLPDCGGTVKITTSRNGSSEQVNIQLRDVVHCSNFDILSANGDQVLYSVKKLGGKDRARSGSYTIPSGLIDFGWNSIRVVVRSNSGAHSDTIRVKFAQVPVLPAPPVVVVTPASGSGW